MVENARITPLDIIDKVVSIEWLYQRVFGTLLPGLIYDRHIEHDINMLKNIYGFTEITEIFTTPIDRLEFSDLTKIIFKYQDKALQNNWT